MWKDDAAQHYDTVPQQFVTKLLVLLLPLSVSTVNEHEAASSECLLCLSLQALLGATTSSSTPSAPAGDVSAAGLGANDLAACTFVLCHIYHYQQYGAIALASTRIIIDPSLNIQPSYWTRTIFAIRVNSCCSSLAAFTRFDTSTHLDTQYNRQ